MKISRLLKILEDLVALKFSDPKGKHGKRFYRNLHRILRAFLSQDGLPLKTKLRALTPSMAVYAKVRFHEQIVSEDVKNCVLFIVLEVARVLLESEYLKLRENDPSKCLFVQTLQQAKCRLKSSPDGRLFEALGNVMTTEWSHPVLLKMFQQEHSQSETIPYAAFIESVENSDIVRLRVRLLLESGCRELANNLISWCVASRMFDRDIYILSQRLNFLHGSDRAEEFHQLCRQISCCTARELLDSAKQGTIVGMERSFLLTMTRTLFLLDWIKATDLSCTRELLKHWLAMEFETLKRERRSAIAAFSKVIALAHSVRQLVLFVDVLESQFGSEFLTFCSELMEQTIRQERHRLNCARLYRRDAEDVEDAAENLLSICRILGRIYKDHCQMNLSCRLSSLYLDPTVADFGCLEKDYIDLECPPSSDPYPPPHICASIYRTLLSAVELLRPDSFALSSLWPELKPVLVNYMEDAGFRYSEAKNRFKSHLRRVEARECFRSGNWKMWMNNADTDNGLETSSPRKKEQRTSNGFVKSVKKEPKADGKGSKRKQISEDEYGIMSHGSIRDSASSEQVSKKMRLGCVPPSKHITLQSVLDASGDVAGESGGENSTDSGAVSEHSSGPRKMSGSEMRRQSLLARRYVWNSSTSMSTSSASTSNSWKFNSIDSLTMGKSNKGLTRQDNDGIRKNVELLSTGACSNSSVGNCSNSGSCSCSLAAGKLDKNSNLPVESANASNMTDINSSVIVNPSSCSNAVSLNAEVPKAKGRTSVLGGWESKFMAYCSSISESDVEFEQCFESLTVATTNGTDSAVVTTDSPVVTSTSITSVSCANTPVNIVSCKTFASESNQSQFRFLESLSSLKVACVSKNQTSCSSKSSECRLRDSNTLGVVVDDAEPSVSIVMARHAVKPNLTAVLDFGLNGSAPVMIDTCQSSIKASTPGSNSAYNSEVVSSGSKVTLTTTLDVESCRKFEHSSVFVRTKNELSDVTSDFSETSVSPALCTRKISSASIQWDIRQSRVHLMSSKLKHETMATDMLSSEDPVTAGVEALSPSLACRMEKPVPLPPVNSLTRTLTGSFLNEALNGKLEVGSASSVCPRNGESDVTTTSVSLDCCSHASSRSAHVSFTSLPGAATSVVVATASDESSSSKVVSSRVPVMSVAEEARSMSVEPQPAVLADSTTYAMDKLVTITMRVTPPGTDGPGTVTPESVACFQQTAVADELSQTEESSPHDIIAGVNRTSLETPVSDTLPVSSQNVVEMLETVGQKVTCHKKKRHSVDFVERLWKMLRPDSKASSSSSSPDLTGMNATKGNYGIVDHENGSTIAMDAVVTEDLIESSTSLETLGNIVLDDPQINLLDCSLSKAGVSENALVVGFQDSCTENDDLHQKLSEAADNLRDLQSDQIFGIIDSSLTLQTDVGHVELIDVATDSTPDLKTDGMKTELVVDSQLMDMSMFNAPDNEQHLMLYNSLRQENERSQDSHHMLAVLRFDDSKVAVSPTNLFYYERACPGVRDMLTNCKPDEGDLSCDKKDALNSGQSLVDVKSLASLSTVPDVGSASDGFLKRKDGLDDRPEIQTEPTCADEKLRSDVPVVHDYFLMDQESSGTSCCKGGQGLVGDDSNKGEVACMGNVASEKHLNNDQSTGVEKLSKGRNHGAENFSKAQGSIVKKSGNVQDNIERKSGKGQSPPGEGQSPIEVRQRKNNPGAGVFCDLCSKSLSSDRAFRMHLVKLHGIDIVNKLTPEEAYRCRLCDLRSKLLSICMCKSKSDKTVRSSEKVSKSKLPDKPSVLQDSLENVTSCRKKEVRRCNDRKDSPDDNSGRDRLSHGNVDRSHNRESNSQGKEKKKSNSLDISVASGSKVGGRKDNVGVEGSTERMPRKRWICGTRKSANDSSASVDNRRGTRQPSGGLSKKPLFVEEYGETTDVSFPSVPRRSNARKCNAEVDSGRVNAAIAICPSVEGIENSSQKRWMLRDRLKGKTT